MTSPWRRPLAAFATLAVCVAVLHADFPKPLGAVNDFAEVLSEEQAATLTTLLEKLEQDTTAQVAVATVATLDGMSHDTTTSDLESLLRRVIREETGLTPVAPADRWRGGTLVLRPGNPSLQEKTWPIETFFNKVVMIRNRLRTLEQQVNALEIDQELKVKLQGYITGCYGSLTSFNVLFADDADQFKGSGE